MPYKTFKYLESEHQQLVGAVGAVGAVISVISVISVTLRSFTVES